MYCALIGDIVHSREIKNRADVQMQLHQTLDDINDRFKKDIASKFTITIGDEFQGLHYSPQNIIEIIDTIKMALYPIKFRFGVGFGEMNTRINENMAIGADGPAYYAAREAIEKIKSIKHQYERPIKDIMFAYDNPKMKSRLELVNATLSTCSYIEDKWSDKQREVIKKLIQENSSQRELADFLGLEQSSIQRRLYASGFYTYKYAKKNISNVMNDIWEEVNEQ